MQVELYVAVMGGFVIAFFLIAGEIAALRTRIPALYARFQSQYQSGHKVRLSIEITGVVLFFLVQPIIVAVLVVLALDQVNTTFSGMAMQQLRHLISDIVK